MKKLIIIFVIIAVTAAIGGYCYLKIFNYTPNFTNYEPKEEFKPAYNSLVERVAEKDDSYDIEETIRIIHGLEIAQSHSTDFIDFLEFMAKQDYSKVSKEVVSAKLMLLPILQELFDLKQQYKDASNIWNILGNAAKTTGESEGGSSLAIAMMNPAAASNVATGFVNNAFNEYCKAQEVKWQLKRKINGVRMEYINYLGTFSPVYHKLMKEWDRICIDKDKAYLTLYAGDMDEAFIASNDVLKKHPVNREALLLQALASINLGSGKTGSMLIDPERSFTFPKNSEIPDVVILPNYYSHAERLLDYYIDLYPNRSAPALLLKGMLCSKQGKEKLALSYFDQSAIEYPKQAETLKDLLEPYKNRAYLNQSVEGKYLLQLYHSTMEGYGIFSPNFQKADYYVQRGMLTESKGEIFKHFFRRGNQGVYHCLLSDIQFCEDFLYSSFKQLLLEQSFIDISIDQTTDWKFKKKEDEIKVSIENNSDINIDNVRVFLCLHYTDMYKDEHDIIKVPMSKNKIPSRSKEDLGKVTLENIQNKGFSDIVNFKAIVMTDDKICWINSVEQKRNHAINTVNKNQYHSDNIIDKKKRSYLRDFSLDEKKIGKIITASFRSKDSRTNVSELIGSKNSILNSMFGSADKLLSGISLYKDGIIIELPRILVLIDPVFSINHIQDSENVKFTDETYLAGDVMRLKFKYKPKKGEIFPLYIYSDFVNYKIDLRLNDKNEVELKDISFS